MDTPIISRSGRVLKKSAKLLEMENENKPRILPKTNRSMELSTLNKSSNGIKVKLNFSGNSKFPTITKIVEDLVVEESNDEKQLLETLESDKGHIQATNNALFVKIKNDPEEFSENKRKEDFDLENVKKSKFFSEFGFDSKEEKCVSLVKSATSTNEEASFQNNFSPIHLKMNQSDRAQSFSASTPKVQPALFRSIQEQRRVNQANRAKLQLLHQQQNPQPIYKNIKTKNSNNLVEEEAIKRKKSSISAFFLWCKENRSHIASKYPDLDFCNMSKKMGQIWRQLPQSEKTSWTNKAKTISEHGTAFSGGKTQFNSFYYFEESGLKPEIILGDVTLPITIKYDKTFDENFICNDDDEAVFEEESHRIGTKLVDAQAYLNILGDSLVAVGTYIKSGVKYNSDIDYPSMAALSTLLDTALVAMGSMAFLTLSVPLNVRPNEEKIKRAIENITYFMPPSEIN